MSGTGVTSEAPPTSDPAYPAYTQGENCWLCPLTRLFVRQRSATPPPANAERVDERWLTQKTRSEQGQGRGGEPRTHRPLGALPSGETHDVSSPTLLPPPAATQTQADCSLCRITGGLGMSFVGATALHEAYLLGALTRDIPRRRPLWGATLSLGGAALLTGGLARFVGVWRWEREAPTQTAAAVAH